MSTLAGRPPLVIERAEGVRLYAADGREFYDTISSWWCNVHGHCHPRIREAINRQLGRLDHVLFASVTHEGAIELAERLVTAAPEGLTRVFYSDDGSTAVEVALKMSLQYHRNAGDQGRTRFVCLERGYHGDTVGAMSVSGVSLYHGAFAPLMFEGLRVPCPYCYRCPLALRSDSCDGECARFLEETLAARGETISGVILEPLLMAAGGMIVYPPRYLQRAAAAAKAAGAHLILDEVATGFGRTGPMFACPAAGVSPDFMCLSKGLTSGTLPLATTLTTEAVYEGFLGPAGSGRTFYHGHTFTANALGCAAALASLDLFEETQLLNHVRETSVHLAGRMREFERLAAVGDVRSIGMVGAVELVGDRGTREPLPSDDARLSQVYAHALDAGIILRPLGNVVYVFPPLCTTLRELDDMLDRMLGVLTRLFGG
jgi:adenosylmethionine-8-amino-7-oxononanoate aminotransferase